MSNYSSNNNQSFAMNGQYPPAFMPSNQGYGFQYPQQFIPYGQYQWPMPQQPMMMPQQPMMYQPMMQQPMMYQPMPQQPMPQKRKLTPEQPVVKQEIQQSSDMDSVINSIGKLNVNPKKTKLSTFTKKEGGYVVRSIRCITKTDNPETTNYLVTFMDNSTQEIKQSDISESVIATYNIISNHNQSFTGLNYSGIVYTRTSSPNCVSIETQTATCLQYAKDNGIKLVETTYGYLEDNGVSGRFMKNLKHELGFWDMCFNSGQNLIIYAVDRLSRNHEKGMQFIETMLKRGLTIHFVTEQIVLSDSDRSKMDTVSKLLQQAQDFSDQISSRVKNTFTRLRNEKNYFSGNTKYGFARYLNRTAGKYQMLKNNEEIKIIDQIVKIYNNKFNNIMDYRNYSRLQKLRALSFELKQKGFVNRHGKPFSIGMLKSIISMKYNSNQLSTIAEH